MRNRPVNKRKVNAALNLEFIAEQLEMRKMVYRAPRRRPVPYAYEGHIKEMHVSDVNVDRDAIEESNHAFAAARAAREANCWTIQYA